MCDQQTPVSSEFLFSNKNQNKIMNYYEEKGDFLKYLRKTMRIMRLSLFLIVISTAMAFSANSYSQNTKLTLDLNNATVKEVLKAIENQSEFLFFYQEKHVDLNRQVTLHANEQEVETILNQLFAGTDNIYVINDRQIVIGVAPRKELEKQIQNSKGNVKPVIDQPQQKEITGKVTDTGGLPLPGVSVIVKGTTIGTVTNADGEFSLNIPLNAETLQFSFVGMRTQEVVVENQTSFSVRMEEETIGLEEVVAVGYGMSLKMVMILTSIPIPTFLMRYLKPHQLLNTIYQSTVDHKKANILYLLIT
jgi:TonB-dependent starch-binding outer membrane protein SusC